MARIRITDVAPRDGLQNEPGVIPTPDKLRLIELLADAHLDEIELTSFVSPKWVPQLGDAQELLAAAHNLFAARRAAGRHVPIASVLVPNAQGFERALAVHQSGFPLKIALFTAASETFAQRNTNATIAQTIERFAQFVPAARAASMTIRAYISCAIACPFEGPIAPAQVRRVADALTDLLGPHAELDLADTIGVATVPQMHALLAHFTDHIARGPDHFTLHLHDTKGHAAHVARAAIDQGVRSFDASVAGLGGCPYASTPDRRAPGNISTEALLAAIHDAGHTTSIVPAALNIAGHHARNIVAIARFSQE